MSETRLSAKDIINYLLEECENEEQKTLDNYVNELTCLKRKNKFMSRLLAALKGLEEEVRDSHVADNNEKIMKALEKIDKVLSF